MTRRCWTTIPVTKTQHGFGAITLARDDDVGPARIRGRSGEQNHRDHPTWLRGSFDSRSTILD